MEPNAVLLYCCNLEIGIPKATASTRHQPQQQQLETVACHPRSNGPLAALHLLHSIYAIAPKSMFAVNGKIIYLNKIYSTRHRLQFTMGVARAVRKLLLTSMARQNRGDTTPPVFVHYSPHSMWFNMLFPVL